MPPIEEAIAIHRQRVTALREELRRVGLEHPQLTLEIGCGHGHYMTAYAAAHPGEFCIAIDIIQERLDKSQRKSDRARLNNVNWIRAEAQDLLEALPPETRFTGRILVLFPDPWPKRRHNRRRIVSPKTLNAIARVLTDGALLRMASDHRDYIRWMLFHTLENAAFQWLARKPADWRQRPVDWAATRYEEKAAEQGIDSIHLEFKRLPRQ